ncbi:MAG: RidA family protein [Akkermansiaceae bacterium]|nr:RidA family protein [Akkermansiaceae bacterium]
MKHPLAHCWMLAAMLSLIPSLEAAPAGAPVVRVGAADPLLWTPQVLTSDLSRTLQPWNEAGRLVRLHVVVSDPAAAALAWQSLAESFPMGGNGPAITIVETALPEGARFAVDATLVPRPGHAPVEGSRVLAPGPRLFVSGQAEKGDGTLAGATRATLQSLEKSLLHAGSNKERVVQVKAFFSPMGEAATVRNEVARFFGDQTPPLVLTEWGSPLIEIEVVASAPEAPAESPILEFLTPPGMTTPTVYCRMARVNRGGLLFLGGIYGEGINPETEVRFVLEQLKTRSEMSGSDLEHLIKATYYVSSDGTSKALNLLRPEYYDPLRPPAASKSSVTGVGLPGQAIVLDMIAVEKPR